MKKFFLLSVLLIPATIIYQACKNSTANEADPILVNRDTTVKPGDDFFRYANGTWLKNNPIPASETRWSTWDKNADENYTLIKAMLEESAKNPGAKNSNSQRVGDYYASAMDTDAIEKTGAGAIQHELDLINGIKTIDDLLALVARWQTYEFSPVFGMFIAQDDKISSKYALYFYQSGLSMPDKAYYLSEDPRMKMLRGKLQYHMKNMFVLLGDDSAKAKLEAQTVFQMELEFARHHMDRVDTRDPYKTYNKMSVTQLAKNYPNMQWGKMLEMCGIKNIDSVIVSQPKFLAEINAQLKVQSISNWQTFLRWHLIHAMASHLSSTFVKENFEWQGRTLSGQQAMRPRWKRMQDEINNEMGDLVGQIYVQKYFPASAKQKALEMVDNLLSNYKERLEKLDWMSADTKKRAITKMNAIIKKIGYPDKWKEYNGLEVSRGNFVQNFMNAQLWDFNWNVSKLGKPVDRTEWGMNPQTINAYYNPSNNEIVFPAAILRPAFGDSTRDDAFRYGSIGVVIGHEITHGFDDQGRLYDEKGNLNTWWTAEDSAKFTERSKKLVDEFNSFVAVDTLHVNGSLTLGENIADLGGCNIAYQAFLRTEQGKSKETPGGLTSVQRFFLSYANIWCGQMRDESTIQQVRTNPHSPMNFRVIGPLMNMPEFYEAFGIKKGDKMWRDESLRSKIW